MAWYRTGTVSVTNGSTTVIGSSTAFVANVRAGRGIQLPDGKSYEIINVVSDTELTLATAYGGTTASGQTYQIEPFQGDINDLADKVSQLIDVYDNASDDGNLEIGENRTTAGDAYIDFHSTVGTDYEAKINRKSGSNGNLEISNLGTGNIIVNNNGAERLRVDNAGNVGLNVTSASGKLHVRTTNDGDAGGYFDSNAGSGMIAINPDGTNGNIIRFGGSGTNAANLRFLGSGDTERMRIDPAGRFIVGSSSIGSINYGSNIEPQVQINNTGSSGLGVSRWAASTGGANLQFSKSRGATVGTRGIVSSGDTIGDITFYGDDGTNFILSASINIAIDGTPGTNDMPGRITFSTTADGASSATERMRIDSNGHVRLSNPGASSEIIFSFDPGNNGLSTRDSQIRASNSGSNQTNLKFYTANADAPAERMRIDSTGNVGIGLSSPNQKLDVAGDMRLTNNFANYQLLTSNNRGWRMGTNSTGTTHDYFYIQGTTDGFVSSFIDALTVTPSGNVAIGTISPLCKFDIGPTDGADEGAEIRLRAATNGTVDWSMDVYQSNLRFYTTSKGSGSSFTERMRIDSAGNVGIGTISPSLPLHVVAGAAGASGSALLVGNGSASATTGTGARLYLSGTNNTSRGVYIEGINTGGANNAHDMVLATNGPTAAPIERMRIGASGNVGIGTDNPSTKLQVAGTIYSNVNGEAGYRLYNSGGQAEWFIGQRSNTSHNLTISKIISGSYTDYFTLETNGQIKTADNIILPNAKNIQWLNTSGQIGMSHLVQNDNNYVWYARNSAGNNDAILSFFTGQASGSESFKIIPNVQISGQILNVNTNKLLLQHDGADAYIRTTNANSRMFLGANNSNIVVVQSGFFYPLNDNAIAMGGSSNRWSVVYAATGTINTSDERSKQDIGDIPDDWLDAWGDVNWQRYKFKDAVEAKGDDARWHIGLIAQKVRDSFLDKGIDALSIGLLCYDEWEEEKEEIFNEVEIPAELDDEGNVIKPATTEKVSTGEFKITKEAGNRWGLRYDECFAMEAAYNRRELERKEIRMQALEARLAALEGN